MDSNAEGEERRRDPGRTEHPAESGNSDRDAAAPPAVPPENLRPDSGSAEVDDTRSTRPVSWSGPTDGPDTTRPVDRAEVPAPAPESRRPTQPGHGLSPWSAPPQHRPGPAAASPPPGPSPWLAAPRDRRGPAGGGSPATWPGPGIGPSPWAGPAAGAAPWPASPPTPAAGPHGWMPPPAAPQRRRRPAVLLAVAGAAVVLFVLAVAVVVGLTRPAVLDARSVETGVTDVVRGQLNYTVTDVHCPDGQQARPGTRFTCTATVGGVADRQIPVSVTDRTGNYDVSAPN